MPSLNRSTVSTESLDRSRPLLTRNVGFLGSMGDFPENGDPLLILYFHKLPTPTVSKLLFTVVLFDVGDGNLWEKSP